MNRLRIIALTCTILVTLAVSLGASADSKLDITNWKEILPDAVYTKMVDDSVKNLNSYTASASQFNQNGRKIQSEATNLIVYAEIANRGGRTSAIELRDQAVALLEAAKAKKGEEAQRIMKGVVSLVKKTANGSPGGGTGEYDIAKVTTMKIIMDVSLKEIDKNLTAYKRLTAASFPAKAEEVKYAMYKVAAMSVATTAHLPTADFPPGKTAKDWLASAEDMRKHSLAAAAAATAKKPAEFKKAVNDLSASCSKCHDDFRVQKD